MLSGIEERIVWENRVSRMLSITEKEPESCSAGLGVRPAGKLSVQSRGYHELLCFWKLTFISNQLMGSILVLSFVEKKQFVQLCRTHLCHFVMQLLSLSQHWCALNCVLSDHESWQYDSLGSVIMAPWFEWCTKKQELVVFKLWCAQFSSIYSSVLSKSSVCIIITSM